MTRLTCPFCENQLVRPTGPKKSPILIAGEYPGFRETMSGYPFVGDAGDVLRQELGQYGMDLNSVRVTNMWLHETNDNEDCRTFCFEEFLKECIGRQAILLLGSDCATRLIGEPVTSIAGLCVESMYLGAPIIVCSPNPAIVLREGQTVGELRLSIKRFYDACRKAGLLDG